MRGVYGLRAEQGEKKSKFEDQFQGFCPTCQTSLMNVPGVVDSSRQAARGGMKSEQLSVWQCFLWIPADPLRDTCRISDTVYFTSEPELRYIVTAISSDLTRAEETTFITPRVRHKPSLEETPK